MERPSAEEDVSTLLIALTNGDSTAEAKLIPLIYKELRHLARSLLRRERPEHTLQPTALVHEAYLRMTAKITRVDWRSRSHFYAIAGHVMRQVLVDYGRQKRAIRRGGRNRTIPFEDWIVAPEQRPDQMLALSEALSRLECIDKRQSKIVELRFFSGLSEAEIAASMQVSVRTVKREWNFAKAWLYREMNK